MQGGHESKVATIWAWWMFMCNNKMLTKINKSSAQVNYQRYYKKFKWKFYEDQILSIYWKICCFVCALMDCKKIGLMDSNHKLKTCCDKIVWSLKLWMKSHPKVMIMGHSSFDQLTYLWLPKYLYHFSNKLLNI